MPNYQSKSHVIQFYQSILVTTISLTVIYELRKLLTKQETLAEQWCTWKIPIPLLKHGYCYIYIYIYLGIWKFPLEFEDLKIPNFTTVFVGALFNTITLNIYIHIYTYLVLASRQCFCMFFFFDVNMNNINIYSVINFDNKIIELRFW